MKKIQKSTQWGIADAQPRADDEEDEEEDEEEAADC